MSIHGKKLLGMPWDVTPTVYYYRSDIFEELGLPSEPEDLGTYIQDSENFLNLVQKPKASGKYAFEWKRRRLTGREMKSDIPTAT